MLRNYLTVAFRSLLRYKALSAINIIGLAVGIGSALLILQYVKFELSWDQHHPHADRIYRLLRETKQKSGESTFSWGLSGPLAPAIEAEIPDAELVARRWSHGISMRGNDKTLSVHFVVVDSGYFGMFDCALVDGRDPLDALREPNSILLTETEAHRFFGDEDPVGRTVSAQNAIAEGDYIVSGVLQDPVDNTWVSYGFLTTHYPSEEFSSTHWTDWLPGTWRMTEVFVRFRAGADADASPERLLQGILARNLGPEVATTDRYHLQPLTRAYLHSVEDYGMEWGGNIRFVYGMVALAGLILLVACVNFVNLTMARSSRRVREVAVRKTTGGQRRQLISQFLIESTLVGVLSGFLGLGLAHLTLPYFNNLVELRLSLGASVAFWLTGLCMAVGLLAGAYPALFLSSFSPAGALKGDSGQARGTNLRKVMVVAQFAISIFLIVGTLTVHRQLSYVSSLDPGIDRSAIVELPTILQTRLPHVEAIKAEFLEHPNVLSVTAMDWRSILNPYRITVRRSGEVRGVAVNRIDTDSDFVETFGLQLKSGRDMAFKPHRNLDKGRNEFLLNEAAVKALGFPGSPVGEEVFLVDSSQKRLYGTDEIPGTVVGVLKDFQYRSAHHPIEPLIVHQNYWLSAVYLRIRTSNLAETMDFLKSKWQKLAPELVFSPRFMDQQVEKAYASERRTAMLSTSGAGMAVFVACLGLLGLAAYAAERRSKEIGIRKVLGASVASILGLLSSEFLRLVVIANLIAWPVAYYGADQWLQSFAFRIDLGAWMFAASGAIAAFIALATVVGQTWKAAVADPVRSLRYE